MKTLLTFFGTCLTAAILPYYSSPFSVSTSSANFPGWISEWRGAPLRRLPLGWREGNFTERFPGQVAQFTDGRRRILIRYTARPAWTLRQASVCLRDAGFEVQSLPDELEETGERWACWKAWNSHERWLVRERISDTNGGQWTDVTSWYWSAAYGRSRGPWWALTIFEPLPHPQQGP